MRLALWVTDAWQRGTDPIAAARRAAPDVDEVQGDLDRLTLWRELGEGALLVALPAPGDPRGLPALAPDVQHAAIEAGEAVIAPSLGAVLIPELVEHGPDGIEGSTLTWQAHDATALPTHQVAAHGLSDLERQLRLRLLEATTELEEIGGQPFADSAARELADTTLGADWALPAGLPPRALKVIRLASTISAMADLGARVPDGALTSSRSWARSTALRRLHREAELTLAEATNAAAASLAGWRG